MTDVGARVGVIGTVVVCCIHDRVKRSELTLEFDTAEYDTARYQPQVCTCCENIYLHDSREGATPLCEACRGRNVHPRGEA